jgi:hypothetical protein
MSQNNWYTKLNLIRSYIFKISTPQGSGTGFQIFTNNNDMCGVATAYHVIAHAYEWEEPIKITHFESGMSRLLKVSDIRIIFVYPEKDLAFIIFPKNDMPLKTDALKLIDSKTTLNQGVEIGWCGFPSVAPNDSCFFVGYVSCNVANQEYYLVDGVAINGVSGGPAFYIDAATNEARICGVISAYIPNRATGEVLPGVCVVRSVEPYHETLMKLKSFDEANEKAKEQEIPKNLPLIPPVVLIKKRKNNTKKVKVKKKIK